MTPEGLGLDRRLHLVTGKGGVGKTSVAAALALAAVRAGQRPLVVELGPPSGTSPDASGTGPASGTSPDASGQGSAVGQLLGTGPVTHDATEVARGVWAMQLCFERGLVSYLREHLRIRAWAQRMVRGRALRRFFWAAPGVGEVVVLHELSKLLASGRWRPIIVDMDATGHAVMSWRVLEVFETLLSEGPLQRTLVQMGGYLRDPDVTRMHLVSLPRALVVEETVDLYRQLAAPWGALIVNRMPAASWPAGSARVLDALGHDARVRGRPRARADLQVARRSHRRVEQARQCERRLREAIDLPALCLPELAGGALDGTALDALAHLLQGQPRPERESCPS